MNTSNRIMRVPTTGICVLIGFVILLCSPSQAHAQVPSHTRWNDQILYTIIWEKFCNGNPSNDFMRRQYELTDEGRSGYHGGFRGGDCAGIRKQVPALKRLGITAILVYPVVENDTNGIPGDRTYLATGYRPKSYLRIDPDFAATSDEGSGYSQEFAELIKALHDPATGRRINYIMDLPIGMVGSEHPWVTKAQEFPDYLRPWNPHNPEDNLAKSPAKVGGRDTDNSYGMAVIDQTQGMEHKTGAYGYLTRDVMVGLAHRYDLDGFRYDSAQNYRREFFGNALRDFRQAAARGEVQNDFMHLGEVVITGPLRSWQMSADDHVNRQTQVTDAPAAEMDGLYDWALINAVRSVFAEGKSPQQIVAALRSSSSWDRPHHNVVSMDIYEDGLVQLVKDGHASERNFLAAAFIATINRVPMFYPGNEFGQYVAKPGDWEHLAAQHSEYRQRFTRLLELRNENSEFRTAAVDRLTSSGQVLSYVRADTHERFAVALNVSDKSATANIDLQAEQTRPKQAICRINSDGTNDLGQESVHLAPGPILSITLPPFHAAIVELR